MTAMRQAGEWRHDHVSYSTNQRQRWLLVYNRRSVWRRSDPPTSVAIVYLLRQPGSQWRHTQTQLPQVISYQYYLLQLCGLSVRLSVTILSPVKAAEPMEMPLGCPHAWKGKVVQSLCLPCKEFFWKYAIKLDSMRWFSHQRRTGGKPRLTVWLREQKAALFRFFGRGWPWPLTLTFELGRDFCTVHLTAKFHHPTFNRSEVIVLANKQQTPLKTSTSLRYATPVGRA